ncbi:tripartite tricarboxylate transporter TctB family protein [Phreatobacter sp.]|uniref:tripartite tricarboxylate transporter TctB family protein n=1 Tax=Phreatobacter sp. TaxID=1966341 RepID=UPI003F6FAEB3
MRVNDLVSGAVMIAVALFVIAMTTTFPPFPGQNYGPAVFPRLLASLMIVCGLVLIARGYREWRAGGALFVRPEWAASTGGVISVLLILGSALAYILVVDRIGFVPLTITVLLILFLWFRVRLPVALVTAVVGAFAVNWFFASMMRVPLPRGLMDLIL